MALGYAMPPQTHGPIWRTLSWILVPLVYPDYRRLVLRSAVLTLRLEMLCLLCRVVSPFASPRLLGLLRAWFEDLRADVSAFSRAVQASRVLPVDRALMPDAAAATPGAFRNPWS